MGETCLVLGSWRIRYQQLLVPNMKRVDSIGKTLVGPQLREEIWVGPQAPEGILLGSGSLPILKFRPQSPGSGCFGPD